MEFLKVKGSAIVTSGGREIRLRGVNIGAWMNLENFLNGYPGSEGAIRNEFLNRLGEEKTAFFFDRLLAYMFAEEDVVFLKENGVNVIRLPLNYHHFESDMEPFVYREEGFERLNRALDWCRKHGMYAILDMHTAPGFQGPDWHSDNSSQRSFFWDQIQFQDRFTALWEEIARRYKGDPMIAGYDVLNEPVSNAAYGRFPSPYRSEWQKINRVYRRVVESIRAIDPDHIIYLEGDHLGFCFEGFEAPFADNLVYSSHLYPAAAVGEGVYPGIIDGEYWDKEKLRQTFLKSEGLAFAKKYNVPLWVGEFGTSYAHPEETASRGRVLSDLIEVFEEQGAHWTIWTYKDIGNMGVVQVDPTSVYASKAIPLMRKEQRFIRDAGEGRKKLIELADYMQEVVADPEIDTKLNRYLLEVSVKENYLQNLLVPSYVKQFADMTLEEMDEALKAFALERCVRHPSLDVMKKFLPQEARHERV